MFESECSVTAVGSQGQIYARLHRLGVIGAALVFAAALAIAIGTGSAGAAAKIAVLGSAAPANPACPTDCVATGKTTGFQTSIGKTPSPFVVPYPGKIVAWSIKLAAPNEKQVDFFKQTFGGEAEARISILKPIQKEIKAGKQVYKLKSQAPLEELAPFFGTTTTFTLKDPLKVKTDQIVALTIPTWAPAFAIGQTNNTSWRASRKSNRCADKYVPMGSSHQALNSERQYGCAYKGTRLLYSATLVGRPGG
jgi:hypothetical protein